jgi:hypothetical protein
VLSDELGGVNIVVAEDLEACKIHLIKHTRIILLIILRNSIAHAQIQRNKK